MESAGYSNTPLAKKLGMKSDFRILLVNEPPYYFQLFMDLPDNLEFVETLDTGIDLIHYFTKHMEELERDILALRNCIVQNGAIWISWPKKASKIETNVTEDLIRNLALRNGLVDVKVCAIDSTWSGLKLVIPVKLRLREAKADK